MRRAGMVRVVWYQHRGALLGLGAALAGLAAVLVAAGLRGRAEYAYFLRVGCASPGDGLTGLNHCVFIAAGFPWLNHYDSLPGSGTAFPDSVSLAIMVLFVLAGMFLGAPLMSREYEQGTFRFAWTQGTSRVRWCGLKAGILVLRAAVPAAARFPPAVGAGERGGAVGRPRNHRRAGPGGNGADVHHRRPAPARAGRRPAGEQLLPGPGRPATGRGGRGPADHGLESGRASVRPGRLADQPPLLVLDQLSAGRPVLVVPARDGRRADHRGAPAGRGRDGAGPAAGGPDQEPRRQDSR